MSTFSGFGTMYYGHSDRCPDGSYIATEWIVAFWIPIIPIGSYRLVEGTTKMLVLPPGSRTSYLSAVPVPLNKKQVLRTYGVTAIVAAVVLSIFLLPRILDKGIQMGNNEPVGSLFEAISRIANFSYEPTIQKHPYIKEYLENNSESLDPRLDWALLVTAAGTGYVLLTEEDYPREHAEMTRSIESIGDLSVFVQNFTEFMTKMYEANEQFYRIGMGVWILRQITGPEESTVLNKDEWLRQAGEINVTVGQLVTLTIEDYVKRRK